MRIKTSNKKTIQAHITQTQIDELIKIASKTRKFAFSHRSMHKIWASVLTADGKIFGGCNIESVISWLWTCAERAAIDHAIVNGKYDIIAVCTIDEQMTPTCGACLQYALLFQQVSWEEIILINGDTAGNYEIDLLKDLLPKWYITHNNLKEIKSYSKKK